MCSVGTCFHCLILPIHWRQQGLTPRCGQNWSWTWDEHELTRLRVNHSRFAGSKASAVCSACGLLLVVLSVTDTADVEACGKHLIRYHNRIKSVSEEVTSSGIASSDRLRGRTRNPPSRSRRTKVRPQFARAAVRAAGAWSRRPPPPPRCCRWGRAPNPICCGATGEGPAAAAARPGRLYCPAPAAGGGRSKGRGGRSARSKIGSPSCCSSQRWSTPWDKTSYFASLWWQLLESRENRGLYHQGGTWAYNAIRYGRMKSEISGRCRVQQDSPIHLRFLKKVRVPCHVSRWTPMMDPCPNREEKFILSPLWCNKPGKKENNRLCFSMFTFHCCFYDYDAA